MKRILILEDEPAIAENLRYALETEGFSTFWSNTGKQALELLSTQAFDFIILDIGLPDMSGFEVCRELRLRSEIPVLFLTARSSEIDRVVGLEIGADDYVVKPFSPREVSARVKAILRRSSSPSSPSSQKESSGIFAIDSDKFQISYFGEILPLSRYEYQLLKVLLEKKGRILSREQLMDFAWGNGLTSLDRTVDAHIKTLRAKLKKIRPELDPIVTHRGLGYAMKDLP